MAYDIFISYRRDGGKELARPLKSELELRGYRVFLDFDELKDGVFDRRIMEAIDAAPIFMVILSSHALDRCVNTDDWVRREIEYALEHDRHFIPIDPDRSFTGFPPDIPDSLKAGLGQHQFSQVMFEQLFKVSVDKMVRERIEPLLQRAGRATAQEQVGALFHVETDTACRILKFGEELCSARPDSHTTIRLRKGRHKLEIVSTECPEDRLQLLQTVEDNEMEDILTVELAPVRAKRLREEERKRRDAEQAALPVYKVGDYYDRNGKKGVVFEVSADGRHGKIVGMTETVTAWCPGPRYSILHADDRRDGMRNQRTIERSSVEWRGNYPAFAWCAEQGEEWYLPAIGELETLLLNNTVREAVGRTIERHGGDGLSEKYTGSSYYWSSTEQDQYCAQVAHIDYEEIQFNQKFDYTRVRAIAAF